MQTQKLIGVYANPVSSSTYLYPIEDTLLLVYYLFTDRQTLVEASHIEDAEKPRICVIQSKTDWKIWHNYWKLQQYYNFQELDPYLLLTERFPYNNLAKIFLRNNFEEECLAKLPIFRLFSHAWLDFETPQFSKKFGFVSGTESYYSPGCFGELFSIRFSPHEYIRITAGSKE